MHGSGSRPAIDSPNPDTHIMNKRFKLTLGALLVATSLGAIAQGTAVVTQRDLNQQSRIEDGLRDGTLSTGEAARLEREQANVSRLQAKELQNGKLSPQERSRLDAAQDKASRNIKAATTNGVSGNPQSASSQRMQADVERNVTQQRRIRDGVANDSLTNREVAGLERHQARIDHNEYTAGRNGHVSAREQSRVQGRANHQSDRIYDEKHDAQSRAPG